MTEQEIIDAGIDYTMEHNPVCIAGDAFYEQARQLNRNRSFEAGAKWAIKESINKTCKWMKDKGCFSYLQEDSQTIEDIENIFRKAIEQ